MTRAWICLIGAAGLAAPASPGTARFLMLGECGHGGARIAVPVGPPPLPPTGGCCKDVGCHAGRNRRSGGPARTMA